MCPPLVSMGHIYIARVVGAHVTFKMHEGDVVEAACSIYSALHCPSVIALLGKYGMQVWMRAPSVESVLYVHPCLECYAAGMHEPARWLVYN